MFSKELLDENNRMHQRWQERFQRLYGQKDFVATTESGIPVKAVYAPSDIEHIEFEDIGLPGEYPYTRGIYPMQYQFRPWVNFNVHGYGLPEDTRERMDLLAQQGMKGYFGGSAHNLVFDIPTNAGYDPDHPQAEGRVGQCGVSICNAHDMEKLFHDMPLDKTNVSMVVGEPTVVVQAMFIVAAERMGFAKETLHGNSMNFLFRRWFWGCIGFPPKNSFKLMVDFIRYCSREMPQWNTTNITAATMVGAGASPSQEIGLGLATAIALADACVQAGLHPDDFLPRFGFQLAATNDFFETVAKLRALRRMWAKTSKERFKCENPKAMQLRAEYHTLGNTLTVAEPLNNIARAAFQTLAAVLAGGNGIATSAYDEAFAIPSEEAATFALRTQQIILHETRVTNITDPLAGSYYVEWLTSKLEEEAYKLVEEIDNRGGYIKCWEDGWLTNQLVKRAAKWQADVESGKEVVVGFNKRASKEMPNIEIHGVDPRVEKVSIERVKKYRAERDNARTSAALTRVRKEAEILHKSENGEQGYLMPAVIEAVKADATLGEIMEVLRNVLGWGYGN